MIQVLLVDTLGFSLFWYIWRKFQKRSIDQILGLLFTFFLIVDIARTMFPGLNPGWLAQYVPSCWLNLGTRIILLIVGILDLYGYRKFAEVKKVKSWQHTI